MGHAAGPHPTKSLLLQQLTHILTDHVTAQDAPRHKMRHRTVGVAHTTIIPPHNHLSPYLTMLPFCGPSFVIYG